ncbi:MAG: hypothetical protein B0D91_11590 [Oceanospirillales bacterium LUC14_002_19_P2]|nr:MAG: hypothetical protein B0D91_11590 [Oceanospirillales bacterium LUC14_002_19_P2]
MAKIDFDDQTYTLTSGNNLLDTLLAKNARVPWSCRAGLCHSCLMQATQGKVPLNAATGLSKDQIDNGFFLACQCYPTNDLTIRLPERHLQPQPALITEKAYLSATLLAIRLAPRMPINYRPGQHILLWRNPTSSSRYCLLSQPEQDSELLIHIERRAGSDMSSWLFDEADIGTKVTLSELAGSCHYQPDQNSDSMIILGSGVGIGAAMAIARDALTLTPQTKVATLLHTKAGNPKSFYLQDNVLSKVHITHITSHITTHVIDDLLTDRQYKQAHILLMGDAETVTFVEQHLINKGIPKARISAQPFVKHASD